MRLLKGVSPLIASVLLIAFTMAIAAVLTAWISSFTTAQREKTAVFEEKIQCNYGFIENDIDFTEYNYTDNTNAFFKTRIKNTGTIDISIGKYQTWFEDTTVPIVWTIDNPGNNTAIKKLNDKTPVALITGWHIQLNDSEKKEKGVDLLINKPFKVEEICKLVENGMKIKDKYNGS